MPEKDEVYSSKVSYKGIFNFRSFYEFCYSFLKEEKGLDVSEDEYSEKISGPNKEIVVKWTASRKATDYFKFEIKVEFKITELTEVEVNQGGVKVTTNKGKVEIKTKGNLVRDYEGKFETSAKMKIWRSVYEKWIISQRVSEYEDKLAGLSEAFLGQAKAFLDISGQ